LKKVRIYDLTLDTKDLMDLVLSERQYWGRSPGLLVVDNVSDMVRETNYEEFEQVFIDLKKIARKGETHVLALHHTRRTTAGKPMTQHSGMYGGERGAELVLGLDQQVDDTSSSAGTLIKMGQLSRYLNVHVLKNRNGNSGQTVPLAFYPDTMRIKEVQRDRP
jgi:RecA-family ATPase